jgi:hypothetical protein
MRDRSLPSTHADNCDFHTDQYPWECSCGGLKCEAAAPQNETFWYLATPYNLYPDGLDEAFRIACEARGLLLSYGIPVFSPIVHSHMVAVFCGLPPRDHEIWLPSERPILDCASGIIMLKAKSWETSYGMQKEREAFEASRKPVVWMTPDVVPPELLQIERG